MGAFAAGDVVLLPFPFSDLTASKLRPALLIADAGRGDWIACQITSNPYADPRAIILQADAFDVRGLRRVSYLRIGKIFTANAHLIESVRGSLRASFLQGARAALVEIILGAAPAVR